MISCEVSWYLETKSALNEASSEWSQLWTKPALNLLSTRVHNTTCTVSGPTIKICSSGSHGGTLGSRPPPPPPLSPRHNGSLNVVLKTSICYLPKPTRFNLRATQYFWKGTPPDHPITGMLHVLSTCTSDASVHYSLFHRSPPPPSPGKNPVWNTIHCSLCLQWRYGYGIRHEN